MKKLIICLLLTFTFSIVSEAKTYWFDYVSRWSKTEARQGSACAAAVIVRLDDSTPWIGWQIQNPNTEEWIHNIYIITKSTKTSNKEIIYDGYQKSNPSNKVAILVDEKTPGHISFVFSLNDNHRMLFMGPIIMDN